MSLGNNTGFFIPTSMDLASAYKRLSKNTQTGSKALT